jgi:hypothetical protein
MYGLNYIGTMRANMLGTRFEIFNFGVEAKLMRELPKDFLPKQEMLQVIEYDSNFFAEKPRTFRTTIYNKQETVEFVNLPPKFNASRGCYTLNFFGRVAKASARNF